MQIRETNQTYLSEQAKLRRPRFAFSLTALAVACGGAMNSLAQDQRAPTGMLEEVVVTATRREESAQDVALSITTLGGNYLSERGISDFRDLTKAASGLDLMQQSNAIGSTVRMRGVGARPNSGIDSAVGVLQDGVYQKNVGFSFQELSDIQQVEILRGPQGTLFGKNTISGVIKISTNPPDLDEFSGNVQAVGGNMSNAEFRGVVNIPIIDGKLAARISGFDAQRDGYTENAYRDEETRDMDRWGYRGKLRWAATDTLMLDFSYQKSKSNSKLDSGVVAYGPTSLAQMTSAGFDPADFPVELGKSQEDIRGRGWDQLERYIFNVEWDAGDVVLKLLAAYEEAETFIYNDQNLNVTTIGFPAAITNQTKFKTNTLETQLVSNLDGPLSYVAGIFFQQNKFDSPTNILSTTYLVNGVPGFLDPPTKFVDPYYYYPRQSSANDKSLAGFASVSYQFTDQIKASFGARYTDDQKENIGTPGTYKDFKEWTYSGDVQYQIDDDVMVYFAAQKGFTSGGFNREDIVAVIGEEFRTYSPTTTYNYEVGIKSEWFDNRARLNVSIFTQDFNDYQITQTIPGTGNTAITNAAKVKANGIETDFAVLATDHLTFDGSIAYIKTEYDDYKDAPCSYVIAGNPPLTAPAKCVQQPDGDYAQDLSGENLDNAPELTGNVGGEYRNSLPFGNLEWFVRADAAYRDDTLLDVTLAPASKQDSYTLYSARIGVESLDQGWKLTAWGNNLGDEDYGTYGQLNQFGLFIIQGLPRTYGVTLDYAF